MLVITSIPSKNIPEIRIIFFDKFVHFSEYFILSFLFVNYQIEKGNSFKKNIINLSKILIIMPILDELHQLFIPGRSCSIYDIIADILGILVFMLLYYSYYTFWRKQHAF